MKKIHTAILALLASSSVFAAAPSSSNISLPGGGKVEPTKSLTISLAPLLKDVYYDVSCQITNPQDESVDMRFDATAPGAWVNLSEFDLNDARMENAQGSVKPGSNTLLLKEVYIPHTVLNESTVVFQNLDFSLSVEVGKCSAKPAMRIKPVTTYKSGYFWFYNDTDSFMEFEVGNFFPTIYTIGPFSKQFVSVSTDNQNVTINHIYY